MNPYAQRRFWKYFLLAFALVIASGSLLYTGYLVKSIKQSERTRAEIWALSIKQMAAADDNDFLQYISAVRDSLTVPAIIVDGKGDFITTRGLDSNRTYIRIPATLGSRKIKKYDPNYFKAELESMKQEHEPITLQAFGNNWYVYYHDSFVLRQLKI